jgi:ATP-binding cassette subfamily B protein
VGQTSDAEPLIGVEDMETPYWAQSQLDATRSGIWTVARGAPRTAAELIRWSWRAAPRWTLVALLVQLATAVVTAFGLLATVDVFTNLLAEGPTPQRVVDALRALAVVVGAVVVRGLLQAAVGAVQAELVPRIEQRAQDELYSGLVDVELVAFDDADFVTLVERAEFALINIRFGAAMVGDLVAAVVAIAAAVVTAGVLHPLLGPLVLVTALPQVWAGMRRPAAHRGDGPDKREPAPPGRHRRPAERAGECRGAARLHRPADRAARATAGSRRRWPTTPSRWDGGRTCSPRSGARSPGSAPAWATWRSGCSCTSGSCRWRWPGPPCLRCAPPPRRSSAASTRSTRCSRSACTSTCTARASPTSPPAAVPPAVHVLDRGPQTIDLDGVSFRYPGQDQDAVHDVSLTLRRGQVIALVGENGSGKTTLAKLITGLYLPTSGTVTWDGRATVQVDADDLWDRVAVVMQEPRWPVTFANNIRIGRPGRPDPDDAALGQELFTLQARAYADGQIPATDP